MKEIKRDKQKKYYRKKHSLEQFKKTKHTHTHSHGNFQMKKVAVRSERERIIFKEVEKEKGGGEE